MAASIFLLCILAVSSLRFASASSMCPLQSHLFLNALQLQCPLSIPSSSAIEVNGVSLDRALSSSQKNAYTAVLFYASWCPFSHGVQSTFDTLSSMFPQIRHLAVEQSSAMPRWEDGRFLPRVSYICGVFSRYGIHSLPAVLMVNQTARVRYYGPKDLVSLVSFYERTTGVEPVEFFTEDQPSSLGSSEKPLLQLWSWSSFKEFLAQEPYLVFSILFLCLRAFLYLFPKMLSCLKAFWVSHVHLNLGIFGETSQLLGHFLHAIDVKSVWSKLRQCKTRNFREGAKNARVWASSLASVSLGESSSARPQPVGDF